MADNQAESSNSQSADPPTDAPVQQHQLQSLEQRIEQRFEQVLQSLTTLRESRRSSRHQSRSNSPTHGTAPVPALPTVQPPLVTTAAPVASKPQFRPRDVGYFDPNPDVMPVETKDTYNVYHNVFSFVQRVRVKAKTMDANVLRDNLDACLL
ncbi:MAG: hypothetical protein LQ350_007783, partial [Teloschistes chrysophthalmus]